MNTPGRHGGYHVLGFVSIALLLLGVGCVQQTTNTNPTRYGAPIPAVPQVIQKQEVPLAPVPQDPLSYDSVCLRNEKAFWEILKQNNQDRGVRVLTEAMAEKTVDGWKPQLLCFNERGRIYFTMQAIEKKQAEVMTQPVIALAAGETLRRLVTKPGIPNFSLEMLGFFDPETSQVSFSEPIAMAGVGDIAALYNLRAVWNNDFDGMSVEADTGGGDMGYVWYATVNFNTKEKKVSVSQCQMSGGLDGSADRRDCKKF